MKFKLLLQLLRFHHIFVIFFYLSKLLNIKKMLLKFIQVLKLLDFYIFKIEKAIQQIH